MRFQSEDPPPVDDDRRKNPADGGRRGDEDEEDHEEGEGGDAHDEVQPATHWWRGGPSIMLPRITTR